jgi:dienelactone hydrolase
MAPSRIVTEEVTYSAGKTKMSGYLAHPPHAKGLPGILVVHEWWGHNDYVRSRADMLAREGYVALAVDMYGDGKKADHPDDAKKFSAEVFSRLDDAEARFDAARKLLAEHDTTDPEKIAAVGYCFGGGIVLHMARKGMDLDVAASFHGSLATKTPAAKGSIKGKVFIAHGAADPMVPPDQVEAFKKEMEAAGANLHFHAYDGATHAFSNPNATQIGKQYDLPIAYDEKADKASWKALMDLLADVFPKRAE